VTLEVHSEKDKDVRAELARATVESGWKLYELKTSGLSLEEIFLKLTTKDLSEDSAAEARQLIRWTPSDPLDPYAWVMNE